VEIMAKRKSKAYVKKYAGKTEDEWRDWGESFGKRLDRSGRQFAEEIDYIARRFRNHFDDKGKEWEMKYKGWWFRSFGFIGPLIGSVLGIIFLAIGILVLNLINASLGNGFIFSLTDFLQGNLHWFFGAFLFFGYSDYFFKRSPGFYRVISPIILGIGVVIVIWIVAGILNLINAYAQSSAIGVVSGFLYSNLFGLFVLFVALGYLVMIIKRMVMNVVR
jgi:hypothetical protein